MLTVLVIYESPFAFCHIIRPRELTSVPILFLKFYLYITGRGVSTPSSVLENGALSAFGVLVMF